MADQTDSRVNLFHSIPELSTQDNRRRLKRLRRFRRYENGVGECAIYALKHMVKVLRELGTHHETLTTLAELEGTSDVDYQLLDLLEHFFTVVLKTQTELNGHFFFAEEDFVKVTLNFGLHSGLFPIPANPNEGSWKHSILLATSERVVKTYVGHGTVDLKVFGLKFFHSEEVDFEVNERILEFSSSRVDSESFRGFERIIKQSKPTSQIPTLPAFLGGAKVASA